MIPWEVRLLGRPEARRGDEVAHLRSRPTWALLAALRHPAGVARHTLVERFWPDTDHGRVSLRLAVKSLRDTFGPEVVTEHGGRLLLNRADLDLDLDRIERADAVTDPDERRRLLHEVEPLLDGELLEGCDDPDASVVRWIGGERARWNERCARLLNEIAAHREADRDPHGAFDALRRSLRLAPEDTDAWERAWRLGKQIGRTPDTQALQRTLTFSEAIARARVREDAGRRPSLRESRAFEELLRQRMESLPEGQRRAFPALSVFTSPFTPLLARRVCDIRPALLRQAAERELLDTMPDGRYVLRETIREILWPRLAEGSRTRLLDRLRDVCWEWYRPTKHGGSSDPFLSMDDASHHFNRVAVWRMTQEPDEERIYFIGEIFNHHLSGDREAAIAYLARAGDDDHLPTRVRRLAHHYAGYVAFREGDFGRARRFLRKALDGDEEDAISETRSTLFHLAVSCHHLELPNEALETIRRCREESERAQDAGMVFQSLSFEGEILRLRGETGAALELQERALTLTREIRLSAMTLADIHFQIGTTQRLLGRTDDAREAMETALRIRLERGVENGVADCLRELSRLRIDDGDRIGARLFLEHALILYDRVGNGGGAAAAKMLLGDIDASEGRGEAARARWEEALAHWEAAGHAGWTAQVRQRLER